MRWPLGICIEDMDLPVGSARYLQCAALRGDEPGLGLSRAGAVVWKEVAPVDLALSADDRLTLRRREGAPGVVLRRGGRSHEVAEEQPTFLLDLDELEVAGRRLRLHVHGRMWRGRAPRSVPAPPPTPDRELAPGANIIEVNLTPPYIAPRRTVVHALLRHWPVTLLLLALLAGLGYGVYRLIS